MPMPGVHNTFKSDREPAPSRAGPIAGATTAVAAEARRARGRALGSLTVTLTSLIREKICPWSYGSRTEGHLERDGIAIET